MYRDGAREPAFSAAHIAHLLDRSET